MMPPPNLRAIFDSEFDYVCRALRRLGVPERDLEDAAQETFLAIHDKLATYDPARPLRPWLFAFALRIAANHRRKKTTAPTDTADQMPSTSQTPEQDVASAQAKTLALRAIEELVPERREIFVMHDIEGFGAPEIAELLEIPVNTVYSRLRVARADFERAARVLVARGRR